jgi:hypothetical protein
MSSDTSRERELALSSALEFARDRADIGFADLVTGADMIYRWLVGPAYFLLIFSEVRRQGDPPTGRNGAVVTQIRDDEEFDLELGEFDAKGAAVPDREGDATDDPTWTVDDDTVATLTVDPADPRKATVSGGQPGSTTVTIDPHIPNVEPITHAIDVVAGNAVTASVTESAPRPQTPASQG